MEKADNNSEIMFIVWDADLKYGDSKPVGRDYLNETG